MKDDEFLKGLADLKNQRWGTIHTYNQMDNEDELLEKLAELEHEQWIDWSQAIIKDLNRLIGISKKNKQDMTTSDYAFIDEQKSRIRRWNRLNCPYDELSEDMKESDRGYARKVIEAFNQMGDMEEVIDPDYPFEEVLYRLVLTFDGLYDLYIDDGVRLEFDTYEDLKTFIDTHQNILIETRRQ